VLSYLNKQDFATFDDEFETMIRKARQLAIKAGMKCSDIKKSRYADELSLLRKRLYPDYLSVN